MLLIHGQAGESTSIYLPSNQTAALYKMETGHLVKRKEKH